MHFSQIITAALALPALSFAAALPERRQNIDCAQYNTLSVGSMTISNQNEREGDVSLQVRPTNGDWFQIAVAKKGQSAQAVNIFGDGAGTKNLRVCSSTGYCYYPAGNNPNKQWNMLRSGDRWNFGLTVLDGSDDGQVQALCGVGAKVVDGQTTAVPAPPSTTTTLAPPTTTTTSKISTTTKADTTTTSKSTSTKTTKTKTTKTSSSTSTSTKSKN